MIESTSIDSFTGVQIIGIIITGFLLVKTVLDHKQNKLGKGGFILWLIIWGSAFLVFLIPGLAHLILNLIAVQNVVLISLVFSNMLLFVLIFILYEKVQKSDKKFKLFVQKLALENELKNKDYDKTNMDDSDSKKDD